MKESHLGRTLADALAFGLAREERAELEEAMADCLGRGGGKRGTQVKCQTLASAILAPSIRASSMRPIASVAWSAHKPGDKGFKHNRLVTGGASTEEVRFWERYPLTWDLSRCLYSSRTNTGDRMARERCRYEPI